MEVYIAVYQVTRLKNEDDAELADKTGGLSYRSYLYKWFMYIIDKFKRG